MEEIRAAFESYQELQKEGRYREALPFAQEVVRRMEEGLGRDHPAVAIALNHLASLYYYQGRYSPAELLYQRGLAIKEKALSLTAHLSHLFEDGHFFNRFSTRKTGYRLSVLAYKFYMKLIQKSETLF